MNERVALCAAVLVYLAVAFVWPSWRVWRATGLNPYVLPATDDAHGFVGAGMRIVIIGLLAYALVELAGPPAAPDLGTLRWLARPAVAAAGWLGLAAALAWIVVAQHQMGRSWRVGIDRDHGTGLVTGGLFARSRNPVFLAMRVCLASLVLVRPNVVTVALWLAGDQLMQFQVRLEEAFLRERHGGAYVAYCARVRRWL